MKFPYFFSWAKQTTKDFFKLESAKSASLKTDQGELIDLSSVSYQASFGHHPKAVVKAVKKQLDSLVMAPPKAFFKLKFEQSERLLHFMGLESKGRLFYTTGGSESVENALKMARDFSGKKLIVARQNSYHGATIGALSITGDWRHNDHLTLGDYTVRIPEPMEDPEGLKLESIIKEKHQDIAAFCLETITGGNGVYIPSEKWYKKVQELCDKYSILLILDEVVCGFYRTGKSFGFKHYPFLKPDFICLAKAISAGVIPFGAVWVNEKIASSYDNKVLSCGLTNYAHPMGLAAMKGVLDICESQKFRETLNDNLHFFAEKLDEVKKLKGIKEIRRVGMLAAIEHTLTFNFESITKAGLFVVAQNGRLIVAPPLNISKKEFKKGMDRLIKLINEQKES
jgi:taurine--2-oxoglutarate transaminase